MALTDKQDRFCQEYFVDHNATQAAIRAGYSESGAHVQGCQLLSNPNVHARLAELSAAQRTRLKLEPDKVIQEWAWIAFTRWDDLTTWEYYTPPEDKDGNQPPDEMVMRLKPSADLTEGQRASIEQIKTFRGGGWELKMKDAGQALKMIAISMGMASEKIKVENEYIGITEDGLSAKVSMMLLAMPRAMAVKVIWETCRRMIDTMGEAAFLELFKNEDDENED